MAFLAGGAGGSSTDAGSYARAEAERNRAGTTRLVQSREAYKTYDANRSPLAGLAGYEPIKLASISIPKVSVPSVGGFAQITPGRVVAPGIDSSYRRDYEQALNRMRSEAAGLEAQYSKAREQLRRNYQFAETQQERDAIAKQIADLDRRRDEGLQAIREGYEATQAEVRARAVASDEATAGEVVATQDRYNTAATDTAEAMRAAPAGPDGLGVGATEVPLEEVAAYLATVGAAEAENTQRMGDIASEDIRWLGDTLGGESQAQQAGLRNLALSLVSARQAEHAQRVADRIQRERMMFAQQDAALGSEFRQRGFSLNDNANSMLAQMAEAARASAEAYAGRQLQAASQNASMAMQAQSQNASLAMERARLQQSAAQAAASNALARAQFAQSSQIQQAELAMRQREFEAAMAGPQLSPEEAAMQQLALRGQVIDYARNYGSDIIPSSLLNGIPRSALSPLAAAAMSAGASRAEAIRQSGLSMFAR